MIRSILALIFNFLSKSRVYLYSIGVLKSAGVDAMVISIGNISVGGAGKTPLVIWLSRRLTNYKVAVVEKGYRSELTRNDMVFGEKGSDNLDCSVIGDEPCVVWDGIPEGVRLVVSSRKLNGVRALTKRWPDTDIILVDDGFQHLKLRRDIDIVLMDSSVGFNQKLFPKGNLRESYTSLRRAHVVLFTKGDQLSDTKRKDLKERALAINPNLRVFFSSTRFLTSQDISGKSVLPVSAIYNTQYFHKKLKSVGASFKKHISFPDHYNFTKVDIDHIVKTRDETRAEYIVVTSKDWVKLERFFKDRGDIVKSWYEHDIESSEDFLRCCTGL